MGSVVWVGGRGKKGRVGGGRYVDIYRHMQAYMSAVAHLSNPSNSNRYFCMNKFNNHAHPIKDMHTLYSYIHTDSNNIKSTLQSYLQVAANSEMFLPGSPSVFPPPSHTSLASYITSASYILNLDMDKNGVLVQLLSRDSIHSLHRLRSYGL